MSQLNLTMNNTGQQCEEYCFLGWTGSWLSFKKACSSCLKLDLSGLDRSLEGRALTQNEIYIVQRKIIICTLFTLFHGGVKLDTSSNHVFPVSTHNLHILWYFSWMFFPLRKKKCVCIFPTTLLHQICSKRLAAMADMLTEKALHPYNKLILCILSCHTARAHMGAKCTNPSDSFIICGPRIMCLMLHNNVFFFFFFQNLFLF